MVAVNRQHRHRPTGIHNNITAPTTTICRLQEEGKGEEEEEEEEGEEGEGEEEEEEEEEEEGEEEGEGEGEEEVHHGSVHVDW